MIGTWREQEIEPIAAARTAALRSPSQHVQMLAEQNFDKLDGWEQLVYGRGQSSFAGFARGEETTERLRGFSTQMERVLGGVKWREWGSESVASNFVVSNTPGAVMLPFPEYSTYTPPRNDGSGARFIHFEGTRRFQGGAYIRAARTMIQRLGTAG